MLCPLLRKEIVSQNQTHKIICEDCLKEKCAWWYEYVHYKKTGETDGNCAILDIALMITELTGKYDV